MGSKTGGNTEPMPFVRKWGAAAGGEEQQQQPDGSAPPPPGSYDPLANEYAGPAPPPPEPETPTSSSRKRDRSRSRDRSDRKKDRKRDRSRSRERRRRSRSGEKRRKRSRTRSRDRRDRRSRSRSPRDRRSRSKDRKKERSPEGPPGPAPAPIIREPVINPLLRPEAVAEITGATAPEIADQAMALVPTQPRKKERKSRWSEHKSFVPGMPTILPADLPDDARIAYLLQMEIEDATRKLRLGDFAGPADPAMRSPSPEPIYDANGKRLNTRDVRKRQEMEQFRHEKIQQLMKVNSNYRPPTDYRAPNIKLHDKVWIPQEAHPELNFVGLLIGPRGNTLKSLEMETGAKIIIRGKGSIKEGKLANRMGPMPGENEPLHAYVTAGDQATIKKACDRIRQIIAEATCIPDGQNALRQLQLRELALLNGTFRPEDLLNSTRCSNCGSDEHKSWECPEAPNVTASIICTACGCAGHIARDCKNPRPGGAAAADMGMPDFASMDSEYSALMEELGEKPKAAPMPMDPKMAPQPFQLPGTGKGPGGYNNRGGPGGFNPFDNRGGFNPFEQHRQQAAAYAAQSSAAYDQTPAGFYASPGAQRGKNNPYAAGGWYGQAGGAPMPVPVPPPPPPMGGFPPPPPPPPPVPAADLSRLLSAAPPPPPPQ